MLRFRLQELLADRHFQTGTRVTLRELAAATGIGRVTLSKMINQRNYCTVTRHLDALCEFFDCKIEQLVEFIPGTVAPKEAGVGAEKPVAGAKRRRKATRGG
jgi:DNA-binding Xre family transcriptional regulator